MTNNSVGGNVIGAVGEGNQVSASNSAIGSFNKGQQVPLPEAHEKFLECIQKMTELAEAEKAEAKAQADSLKVELEKPAKERNAGFIGRTFKKLCAVAPEAAGQFFGNFTAAYLEHKKVVNFSRRRCQGLLF